MTTYQKGHEPAGAPVTWTKEFRDGHDGQECYFVLHGAGDIEGVVVGLDFEADSICRAFDKAATWRSIALTADVHEADCEWHGRVAAAKERFHE